MNIRYSQSTKTFYPYDIEYPDGIPEDAIDIPQSTHDLALGRSSNQDFNINSEGKLLIFEKPEPPLSDVLKQVIVEIRAERAPIIATLDGIAGRSYRAGDTVTSNAADVAINSLLDITTLPALLNAKSYDEMREVILDEYKKIKDNGPPSIATAFTIG